MPNEARRCGQAIGIRLVLPLGVRPTGEGGFRRVRGGGGCGESYTFTALLTFDVCVLFIWKGGEKSCINHL